jgi:predicted DNA-binding transcriptional regulator YafY
MLIAEKLIESYSDHSIIEHFSSAVEAVKNALRESDYRLIESLSSRTKNQRIKPFSEKMFPNTYFSTIQKAIANQQKIYLEYYIFEKDSHSKREIIPICLDFEPPAWHIWAYCCLKNEYRDFRLDRIKKVEVREKFNRLPQYTEESYLKGISESTYKKKMVVRFHQSIYRLLYHDKYIFGFVSEKELKNEYVQIEFRTEKKIQFTYWLLSWGKNADIVSPKSLKADMKVLVQEIAEHYGV